MQINITSAILTNAVFNGSINGQSNKDDIWETFNWFRDQLSKPDPRLPVPDWALELKKRREQPKAPAVE